MKKLKILLVIGKNTRASAYYRIFNKSEILKRNQNFEVVITYYKSSNLKYFVWEANIIILHATEYCPSIKFIFEIAKAKQIPVVYDADDLFFLEKYIEQLPYLEDFPQEQKEALFDSVRKLEVSYKEANFFIGSTPSLVSFSKAEGKQSFYLKNHLNTFQLELGSLLRNHKKNQKKKDFKIGYFNDSSNQNSDFLKIEGVIRNLLYTYENLRLVLTENTKTNLFYDNYLKRKSKILIFPMVEYERYFFYLANLDLNLAFFENPQNLFQDSASEVKIIEAGILGIPTLCSPISSYTNLYEKFNLENDLICRNEKDWFEKIERFYLNENFYQNVSNKIVEITLENYTPESNSQSLIDVLNEVINSYQYSNSLNYKNKIEVIRNFQDLEEKIYFFSEYEKSDIQKLFEDNKYIFEPIDEEELISKIKNTELANSENPILVDVIIPIYNAYEETKQCIWSVLEYTRQCNLILLNDASPDERVYLLLEKLKDLNKNVNIIHHETNLGFVKTVNEGFQISNRDVVILNSDTIVTKNWLEKLFAISKSKPNVATITPLTNSGTICSIPNFLEDNPIPYGFGIESFSELVEKTSFKIYPEVPSGVGFCMFITRKALNEVGYFDEESFPFGYGEENDFCQRAIQKGFVNLIADNTFIYHKHGASFGTQKKELMENNMKTLIKKHPNYLSEVAHFISSNPLKHFHGFIKKFMQPKNQSSKNIMHVLHNLGGGTEKHVRELVRFSKSDTTHFIYFFKSNQIRLEEWRGGNLVETYIFPIFHEEKNLEAKEFSLHFLNVFNLIIQIFNIGLLHVHQFVHNEQILNVLEKINIPKIFTAHDYYTVCPTIFLINTQNKFCGVCVPELDNTVEYKQCMKRLGLPESQIFSHRNTFQKVFEICSLVIVPNSSMEQYILKTYPALKNKIQVIEHGNTNLKLPAFEKDNKSGNKLRIALLGTLVFHKGLDIARKLFKEFVNENEIEFYVFGEVEPRYIDELIQKNVRILGKYDSFQIVALLHEHNIDLGLHLSICPETFSYTISEFLMAGIPVITSNLGAQGERIQRYNAGWVIADIHDISKIKDTILMIKNNRKILYQIKENIKKVELKSLSDMSSDYRETYFSFFPNDKTNTIHVERKSPVETKFTHEYIKYLTSELRKSEEENNFKQQIDELKIQIHNLEAQVKAYRQSYSFRVGFYLIHPWKIPTMILNKIKRKIASLKK